MGEFINEIIYLSLFIVFILGLAYAARRFLPLLRDKYRSRGILRHHGTLALTSQCSVALVQAGRETLILGLTPNSVTLLGRTTEDERVGGSEGETVITETAQG